ncbi:Riboflavin transporter [Wickerhamomyces ciferrii]|uniref:Riboflavin transporter n=1 Tax=Wickerhamomyces ciferrii (strain ATCC 14091 / BCRC 22168 / CBS 111 / JCM 3599 / NBRC 0793 / NRRL Y-1031 F-60-10) TaxID=1206466 RepID=K0KSV6_WICCF|nr:Riboflavin transporter [Wickerhamomyces ciferrii]CCH46241.1 Riboflavin transporter [Wickerhamomyces ciferrii]
MTSKDSDLRDLEKNQPIGNADSNSNGIQNLTSRYSNHDSKELNETVHLIDEEIEFPEGGWEAYKVVAGGFFTLMITFGLMNTIGAIQAYLTNHQLKNESSSTIGWTFSIHYLVAYAFCLIAGPLFDWKGGRLCAIIGSILLVAGLFITANCDEVYQILLAYGFIVGSGTCLLYTSGLGAVSHYFKRKRATALGISSLGGSVGGVVWPLMLRQLYPKIGYVWSMRVLALCCGICASLACLSVKSRLKKQKEDVIIEKNPIKFMNSSLALRDLFKEKRFLYLTFSIFFCEFSLLMVMTYITSYTIHQGYSESQGFLVLIILNAIGLLGRVIPKYLGDVYGSFNIMIATVGSCAIFILAIWLPFGHNLSVLYAFAGLYGFSSSSTLSLTPVTCGQISRTEDFGKRYGTVYFISSFGNLLALPIGGALIKDGPNGFQNFIILAGVTEVVSVVFFILARYECVGMKWAKI